MSSVAASQPPARFVRVQQVFLALAFPVLLLGLGVRLVATPAFLWLEYHRPGFPADHWGMGLGERMTYGSYGLDYVMNFAPPEYLGGLVDDRGGMLFTPAEVSHMHDVQGVIQWGFAIALVLALLTALCCRYLHRRSPGSASGALFFGAWLTVVLLVGCAVAAVFAWQWFFAVFHSLFFDSGTWTFRITDTLIRLYPTQFWTDAALVVALVAVIGAFTTMLVTRRRMRPASPASQGRDRYDDPARTEPSSEGAARPAPWAEQRPASEKRAPHGGQT